jgi:hypothetical protein
MAGLLLCGCTQPQSAALDADPFIVAASGSVVTVQDASDAKSALPSAQRYCQSIDKVAVVRGLRFHHHGRYARAIDVQFECVEPQV